MPEQTIRDTASRCILFLAVLILAVASMARNNAWNDDAKLWEDAAARSPGNARAHYNLGRIYQDRGLIGQALAEYRTVVRIKPDHPQAHNNLGNIYFVQNRAQETIEEFEIAVKLDPKFTFAHFTLGNIYVSEGRYNEALKHYSAVLALKPSSPYVHNSLGILYEKQNRKDDAIREFQMAVMLFPNFDEAMQNLKRARNTSLRNKRLHEQDSRQ